MKFSGGKTTTFSSMKWLLARLIFVFCFFIKKKKNPQGCTRFTTCYPPMQLSLRVCPQYEVQTLKTSPFLGKSSLSVCFCVCVGGIRVAEVTMVVSEYFSNLGNDHAQVVPLTVFVAVLCLCLIIGHLLEENRWVNESITAILTVISVSLSSLSFSVCVFVCMHL
jgi:hypothetical protein